MLRSLFAVFAFVASLALGIMAAAFVAGLMWGWGTHVFEAGRQLMTRLLGG